MLEHILTNVGITVLTSTFVSNVVHVVREQTAPVETVEHGAAKSNLIKGEAARE